MRTSHSTKRSQKEYTCTQTVENTLFLDDERYTLTNIYGMHGLGPMSVFKHVVQVFPG